MRFYFPIIIFVGALFLVLYTGLIKKNWKEAVDILRITLFFGAVWGIIFYFVFS
jgi:hypothetical protein